MDKNDVHIELETDKLVPLIPSESGNSSNKPSEEHHLHQHENQYEMFQHLNHMYFKSIQGSDGPGVVVLNGENNEILKCTIPRLEDRASGQCYLVNDSTGNTIFVARKGLESINVTSGKDHNNSLGSIKIPIYGRTFQFKSTLGLSFDILAKNGDIFCCPFCITKFSIVSHSDHDTILGSMHFDNKTQTCEMKLCTETLHLNEKTIALISSAGILLFEWYFRKSELGYHGQRGSLCLLTYIAFMALLLITGITVLCVGLYHWLL